MKRFLISAVMVMSVLLTACEKSDTDATLEKAHDVATDAAEATKNAVSEAADATKEGTGQAMEYTGEKVQEAGEAVSETGKSMQNPE
jgi:predicted small secreted protein